MEVNAEKGNNWVDQLDSTQNLKIQELEVKNPILFIFIKTW